MGALVVSSSGRLLGEGFNSVLAQRSSLAHAELLALKSATESLNCHRLDGCTVYCTLEPCVMCMGAMAAHRVSRVVFLCDSPKHGALSRVSLEEGGVFAAPHRVEVVHECSGGGGPQCAHFDGLQKEAGELLRTFFSEKRLIK